MAKVKEQQKRQSAKMLRKELADEKFASNILRLDKSNIKGDIRLALIYLEDGAQFSATQVLKKALSRG